MNLRRFRVVLYAACLLPVDFMVGVFLLGAHLVSLPMMVFRRSVASLKPPDTTSVTIQILNWDGRGLLEEFLPGVIKAANNHEVLVVDNGSTDDSVAFLQAEFPQVRVVRLDHNYGFSGGNNLGMKHVGTDIVVLLNNDMAVETSFLQPLLQPFSDPAVFAVASRITMADTAKARFETGKTRARYDAGLFYVWHDVLTPQDESTAALNIFWAGGGACAIDRRKFEMLGGFDALYHPFYVEDTDLCYQAWRRGWRSLLAPASRVIHKHRGTSGPRFGDLFVNNTTRRNHYLFIWKNVTDFGMLLEHVLRLPVIHYQAIFQYGAAFEYRAYLRAFLLLPRAIRSRWANVGSYSLSDADVLSVSQ
jgi:GT2 family glycosyltransferase